jgi:hypothetical protein
MIHGTFAKVNPNWNILPFANQYCLLSLLFPTIEKGQMLN